MLTVIDKYFLPFGGGRLFLNLIIIILTSIILSVYSTEIMAIITLLVLVSITIVFLGFILKIETIFNQLNIGRSFLVLIFFFILSFSVIFLIFSSEVFSLVPEYFGKDLTLSGRVPIWEYVWTEVQKQLLLGYGFATYWIMGHSRIDIFASHFEGFKVNEAHNGYIEIMLQLGVVGFIFFLFPIIAYIYRMLIYLSDA